APRELRGIHVVPDFDVAVGHTLVPARDPAARHGHDAVGLEAEGRLDPMQERNPVERLEANLGNPGTGHEQPAAIDGALELALDLPLDVPELPILLELLAPPPHAPDRPAGAAEDRFAGVDAAVAETFLRPAS